MGNPDGWEQLHWGLVVCYGTRAASGARCFPARLRALLRSSTTGGGYAGHAPVMLSGMTRPHPHPPPGTNVAPVPLRADIEEEETFHITCHAWCLAGVCHLRDRYRDPAHSGYLTLPPMVGRASTCSAGGAGPRIECRYHICFRVLRRVWRPRSCSIRVPGPRH